MRSFTGVVAGVRVLLREARRPIRGHPPRPVARDAWRGLSGQVATGPATRCARSMRATVFCQGTTGDSSNHRSQGDSAPSATIPSTICQATPQLRMEPQQPPVVQSASMAPVESDPQPVSRRPPGTMISHQVAGGSSCKCPELDQTVSSSQQGRRVQDAPLHGDSPLRLRNPGVQPQADASWSALLATELTGSRSPSLTARLEHRPHRRDDDQNGPAARSAGAQMGQPAPAPPRAPNAVRNARRPLGNGSVSGQVPPPIRQQRAQHRADPHPPAGGHHHRDTGRRWNPSQRRGEHVDRQRADRPDQRGVARGGAAAPPPAAAGS